jgi:hypothetical protein
MNSAIEREIRRLERLGEKVEVVNDEIVIHNEIVPDYIAEAFVERIRKADIDSKYKVTIKPA